MMIRKIKCFLLIVSTLLLTSCEKNIEVIVDLEPRLSVVANIVAGDPMEITVAGTGGGRLDSLDVKIIVNDTKVINLALMNGLYQTNEVSHPGDKLDLYIHDLCGYYPDIKSTTKVPILQGSDSLSLVSAYKIANNNIIPKVNDIFEDSLTVVSGVFNDISKEKDYYQIYIVKCNERVYLRNGSFDPLFEDKRIFASIMDNQIGFTNTITDESFNGGECNFTIFTSYPTGTADYLKKRPGAYLEDISYLDFAVYLVHITEDYYRYIKDVEYALCAQNDILSEPVFNLYTNVEGGYGIFSACSYSIEVVRFKTYFYNFDYDKVDGGW